MEDIKKMVKLAVAKGTPDLSDEERKDFEKALTDIVENGKTPAQAMGFEEAQMEAFYGIGYNLYNAGKFKEAKNIFAGLTHLDSTQWKYWYGLAASFHKLKEFERAKDFYMSWAALEPENPLPYFHASDCCLQLKQEGEAVIFLVFTINRCGENKEYQNIKEKAMAMQKTLMEKIGWIEKG